MLGILMMFVPDDVFASSAVSCMLRGVQLGTALLYCGLLLL